MELSTQRLASALVRAGNPVMVLTQHCEGYPAARQEAGVIVHRTIKPWDWGPLWGFTYISQIGRQIKELAGEWDFCVTRGIYLHCSPAQMICQRLARPFATMPAASGAFGDIAQTRASRFGDVGIRKALRADGHFALSKHIGDELKHHEVPAGKIYPFRNIVDLHSFTPSGEHDRNLFLYAGRFHEQKNLPLLINAFALVHRKNPHAKLLLIGAGSSEASLRQQIGSSSASRAIEIQPWSNNLAQHYRRARAFVLASRSEGVSNAMLEAMACGTPIITTDVSGARETLNIDLQVPFENGFLQGRGGIVSDSEEQSIAAAMMLLLGDDQLRRVMSKDASEYVRTHHSEAECVNLFLNGCNAIIARKNGSAS
ncbi:MAG: glycosyltransferase family 4 protein [Candidatus Sumerlaeota bacterium]